MFAKAAALSALVTGVAGHGAIISPRSRNSVDYLVGVNTPKVRARLCRGPTWLGPRVAAARLGKRGI
jgi:hypothetical protein